MNEIVVHGIPGSPYVRTVLMMLEEKGLPWRLQSIGMGENRSPAYRSIHPFGKIPSIDDGGWRLYETSAILNYLDRVAPDPAMRPGAPRLAARMDQVISMVNAYVASRVSGAVCFPLLIAPIFGIPADLDAARSAIPDALSVIDELAHLLDDQAYMAGGQVSLADMMLAPHLTFLPDFPEGQQLVDRHGNLRAWIGRMKERPSFAATEWKTLLARFPVPEAA